VWSELDLLQLAFDDADEPVEVSDDEVDCGTLEE
jgi:hypothetical protein